MATAAQDTHGIVLVADDLTGACDAAVCFAVSGLATFVGLHVDDKPPAGWQCWAVNTGTRSSSPSQAIEYTQHACEAAIRLGATRIIKKIDSLMRGNIAAELHATRSMLRPDLIVLTPAFPELGRTVRQGRLSIHGHEEAFSICERLSGWKCAPISTSSHEEITDQLRQAIKSGVEVVVPDAFDGNDLRRLIQSAESIDRLLWVGSGGLTRAMAGIADDRRQPGRCIANDGRPVLLCVGSDHSATVAQLEHLKRHEHAILIEAGPGGYQLAAHALSEGRNAALLFKRNLLDGEAPGDLVASIQLNHCGALIVTGGDTALHVLDALGARHIRLCAEILPGVPLGRISGGHADGLVVVTKSGAFGGPDALSRCVEQLCHAPVRSREEALP